MFDANMRYLPKGKKFFAKITYLDMEEQAQLYKKGYKSGDILVCEMLTDCHKEPYVRVTEKEGSFILKDSDSEWDWIIYEGNQDGTGFLNGWEKMIAMDKLKEVL